MKDLTEKKKRKIKGAILSSLIFGLFMLFMAGIMAYFQITEVEKMPSILFIFMEAIFLVPLGGVIYNLFSRIKEIKKGEEDEASKY